MIKSLIRVGAVSLMLASLFANCACESDDSDAPGGEETGDITGFWQIDRSYSVDEVPQRIDVEDKVKIIRNAGGDLSIRYSTWNSPYTVDGGSVSYDGSNIAFARPPGLPGGGSGARIQHNGARIDGGAFKGTWKEVSSSLVYVGDKPAAGQFLMWRDSNPAE